MCATYGLGGGLGGGVPGATMPYGLEPLDERDSQALLREWMQERDGQAKITGKNARNLNPVIRVGAESGAESGGGESSGGDRELALGWWSIWLDGSGPVKFTSFNARDDKLMRSWRKPFQQRALLPATWYIEGKKRWALPDGQLFAIAAITSTVVEEATGEPRLSYSMVTRSGVGEASSVISQRGDSRMPLVLPAEMHDDWLDPARPGDADLVAEVQIGSDEVSRALTTGESDHSQPSTLF